MTKWNKWANLNGCFCLVVEVEDGQNQRYGYWCTRGHPAPGDTMSPQDEVISNLQTHPLSIVSHEPVGGVEEGWLLSKAIDNVISHGLA
jgi:hypothetical protein